MFGYIVVNQSEMKFYIDGDKDYPTICGTGTEDYFGGAWSFVLQTDFNSLPASERVGAGRA